MVLRTGSVTAWPANVCSTVFFNTTTSMDTEQLGRNFSNELQFFDSDPRTWRALKWQMKTDALEWWRDLV